MTSWGSTRKSSAKRRIFGVGCQLVQNCAYFMVSCGGWGEQGNRLIKANQELTVTAGQVFSDHPSKFS